jgi:hypothetical protein
MNSKSVDLTTRLKREITYAATLERRLEAMEMQPIVACGPNFHITMLAREQTTTMQTSAQQPKGYSHVPAVSS